MRGVFKTSPTYLKKDVYSVTCLRRLNMVLCDFRKVIEISDKIDVGPLETLGAVHSCY